jgi:MFS family permease
MGQTLSVFGTEITTVALPLVAVISLHAGADAVGLIAAATYLPNAVMPLFVGNWLDGRRLRPVMILADVIRAGALLLVPLAYLGSFLTLQLLVAVAFVVGAASVAFDIGAFAFIPSVVEESDLGGANQAIQGSFTMAQVAGPGLAGLLSQLIGPALAILFDVGSYFASVLGVYTGGRAERPPPERAETKLPVFDGIRQLLGNPYLRALTIHAAAYNVASQIITVNLVVWVVHDRHAGAGIYGAALSAAGAGAFLGTLSVLRLSRRIGFGHAYVVALVLFTGTPLALAPLPMSGVALGYAVGAIELLAGLGLGAANVLSTTLRQSAVPRGSLARSVGSYRLLIFGVIPLGSALGGLLGSALGSRTGLAIGSVGVAASALPMLGRRVRALRSPADARDIASVQEKTEMKVD